MNNKLKSYLHNYLDENFPFVYEEFSISTTGHRPNKLPGSYNGWNEPSQQAIRKMYFEIIMLLAEEFKCPIRIISGGALGIDQLEMASGLALQNVFNDNSEYHFITEMAIPFLKQADAWKNREDTSRYVYQKLHCDITTFVDMIPKYAVKDTITGEYHQAKLQKRNEYMVDHSDLILAYWDGSTGGTANCVHYLQRQNKPVLNMYDIYQTYYKNY